MADQMVVTKAEMLAEKMVDEKELLLVANLV
jgi:hypothetical protein